MDTEEIQINPQESKASTITPHSQRVPCFYCSNKGVYMCLICHKRLCYGHMLEYNEMNYCMEDLPVYDKHQQW